jgi:hypothetical protein
MCICCIYVNIFLGWQVVYELETAHDIFNGTLAPQVRHFFSKRNFYLYT